ncbi:gluconate 2-dehydrogenase subunit 3 family protein [Pseudomonas sp. LS1212]|uniref:gluconate 2-dehydrogenase subunit 3 family protein n=1 Tax=Pseudomonas sp. LS1212 TaxID=2972478 RepID=UPI00215CD020|nr:gluconate 2-dehydrogenase subunit 3 family protein [Pseudomonas sp. LS1212]UVJ46376.1 gluconate 2-dehydrogenase subunit 3 family protein [Pseudomonas sp. LS1212]
MRGKNKRLETITKSAGHTCSHPADVPAKAWSSAMHDSLRPNTGFSRRRFMSLSGQSLLALGATAVVAQLIPVKLLADETAPELPAGLLRMGRDVYPHDRITDEYYIRPLATLIKEQPTLIDQGLGDLQKRSMKTYDMSFDRLEEAQRVALLEAIEETPFFSAVRTALMFGLYDNKTLFPLFGYEGSSWEKGGYLNRGYNDIDWL